MKRRIVLIILIGLFLLMLPQVILAENVPLSVDYSFSKDSYEVNSEVMMTYSITGGTAPYRNIMYTCYSKDNGSLINIQSGSKSEASGVIKYTPQIGQTSFVSFSFYDSDNRFYTKQLGNIALTGTPSTTPLEVIYNFDQDSYLVNSIITMNYSISGGTAPYKNITYSCYSADNGFLVNIKNGILSESNGTVVYTPKIGQRSFVSFSFYDSENRFYSGQLGDVELTGSLDVSPLKVDCSFDQDSYELNSDIRMTYTISGGTPPYRNISYTCCSEDNGYLVNIKSGSSNESSRTITYTPKIGQRSFVSFSFYDAENRFYTNQLGNVDLSGHSSIIVNSGSCGDNLTWVLDNKGTLTINGTGEIDSSPWKASDIKRIIIQDGVNSIGHEVFSDCINLTHVTMSDSITNIGNNAFYNCNNLTSITIPECLTQIGDDAFAHCYQLRSIWIPNSVESIGGDAFSYCRNLTNVRLSEELREIKSYTFYKCDSLVDIIIPDKVTTICSSAFRDCSQLERVTLSKNLSVIHDLAFDYCPNLTSITIPQSVTCIEYRAFGQCYNLSNVLFATMDEHSDLVIDQDAFFYCDPTFYCYMFTVADTWCLRKNISPIYLDEIDLDSIRTIILPNDFSMAVDEIESLSIQVFPSTDDPILWTSSDPSIVYVENGTVFANKTGVANITATIGTVSASITIQVYTPAISFSFESDEIWLIAHDNIQLSISSFEPAYANASFTWVSSDNTIAIVDSDGYVTSYTPGDVTITATTEKGVSHDCLIHFCYPVTAIEFQPLTVSIVPNQDVQLYANITMRTQSCTNHLVEFVSSNENIAIVDETGLVHTLSEGTVTITATSQSNISSNITLFVDHDWDVPNYTWAESKDSILAQRVCRFDNTHVEAEIKPITSVITKQPTCTEMGETTYISDEFDNDAFSVQTRTLIDVNALGHNWTETEYTWNNNSTVTATRTCKNDETHIDAETVSVSSTIVSPTSDTEGSATYISAEFSKDGFTAQSKSVEIPALREMSVINLPSMLTTIEDEAFENLVCEAIIIPNGCTSIGNHAFRNCKNLKYIKIPASVEIPSNAFEGCENVVIDRTAE